MNTVNTLKLNKAVSKTTSKVKGLPFWKTISRPLAIKISVLLIIVGILGLGAYRIVQINSGKILPKVQIAGISVGGKTPAQAKILVQNYVDKLNAQGLAISYDNQTLSPKLADLGVSFNVEQSVNDAYNFGRSGSVKTKLADNSKMIFRKHNFVINPVVDNPKLDAYLSQISQVVTVAPVNAGLVIDGAGKVSVTPSKAGRGFDEAKLKNDLTVLINQNKLSDTKIVLATSVLTPAVLEAGTADAASQAEKYMNAAPINITYNDQTFVAGRGDIGSWLSFAASGNKLATSVNDGQIGSWANSHVVKFVAIAAIDRQVVDGTGQVLDEGRDGLGVEGKSLISALHNRVMSSQTGGAIAVVTYGIPRGQKTIYPHAQPCRYEGHYADINLSEQTFYAFDGCTLVNQFLISSGKTGPTPTGEFHVYSQSRVTEMRGPGYDLPGVEWVSWFSGDYSVHGTYWHHNFGHPMSHGCVNASNGDAEWFYNWGGVGTPIYIHF